MGYVGTKPTAAPLTSAQLADGLVTAAKLATDAVETAKVKDLNVTTGKIADLNVSTGKLAASAVTQAKTDFIATTSTAAVIAKGTSGDTDGYIQLNCAENTHGIKFKSPTHASAQSYTLTFPGSAPVVDTFLQTDGSGNLSFAVGEVQPTITSFTPTVVNGTISSTVTITGTNFSTIPKVEFQTATGIISDAPTVSYTSATTIAFTTGTSILTNGTNVYLIVTNPDGNAVRSSTLLTVSAAPTWDTTTLANTESAAVVSYTLDTTSDSAATIGTSAVAGSLPSGVTVGSTTNPSGTTYRAILSGTMPTITVQTAYSFTLRVTDAEAQTADQAFTLTSEVGATGGGGFC